MNPLTPKLAIARALRTFLPLLALLLVLSSAGAAQAKAPKLTVHKVYAGQTLGMIAKRYNVTISAICNANDITRKTAIKPGQKLLIPDRADKDGSRARQLRRQGHHAQKDVGAAAAQPRAKPKRATKAADPRLTERSSPKKANNKARSWRQYRRPARRAGYVTLKATGRSWSGYAIIKGNRISGRGRTGFQHGLYSWRTGKEAKIHPRLIRLLVRVSDTFGGRPIRVVSGFREKSHHRESKHKSGRACDFSVPGVPNEALRDYLKTLPNVGVGYYPNASFVHLDVRPTKTSWVDLAGPGQTPRYTHKRRQHPHKRSTHQPVTGPTDDDKGLKLKKKTSDPAKDAAPPPGRDSDLSRSNNGGSE